MEEHRQTPIHITELKENNDREGFSDVTEKLNELIEKLNTSKKRDFWDRFQILASFISSVLFAGVGLYFTTVYNDRESKRQEDLQKSQLSREDREEKRQIEMQNIQKEITQLETIIKLAPLLTSKDEETKRYAIITLQALDKNKIISIPTETNTNSTKHSKAQSINHLHSNNTPNNLLDNFVKIALAENSTILSRNNAVKELRNIAISPNSSNAVKEKATEYVTKIAISKTIPKETQTVANNYLKEIKGIPPDEISSKVSNQYISRKIDEIILHHTFMPRIENYKGPETIFNIAKFNVESLKWTNVGWHYIISPDGIVWTGRPLNINWSGIGRGYTGQAISVELILNGDEELPTELQKKSLGILLKTLCEKFSIDVSKNFDENHGFHRDHQHNKTCPGKIITKEMVLAWINN